MDSRVAPTGLFPGYIVQLVPAAGSRFLMPPGLYRVVRPLPVELDGEARCLVQSLSDGHLRSVNEACLIVFAPPTTTAARPGLAQNAQARGVAQGEQLRRKVPSAATKSVAAKPKTKVAAVAARMSKASVKARPKKAKKRS